MHATVRRSPNHREHALSSLATILPAAAAGEGEGFHAPTIADFFPAPFLLEGTFLEVNRIQLVRLLVAVVLVVLMVLVARRATPGARPRAERRRAAAGLRPHQRRPGDPRRQGRRKYVPLLTTLFFAILAFNLTGVIPFLNIAGTSLIGLPLMLALWVYVMYLGAGIRAHGVGGFLKNNLFPPASRRSCTCC